MELQPRGFNETAVGRGEGAGGVGASEGGPVGVKAMEVPHGRRPSWTRCRSGPTTLAETIPMQLSPLRAWGLWGGQQGETRERPGACAGTPVRGLGRDPGFKEILVLSYFSSISSSSGEGFIFT